MGLAEIIVGPKIEIAPYLPLYNNIQKYTMPLRTLLTLYLLTTDFLKFLH
jgi:hypothetical protein